MPFKRHILPCLLAGLIAAFLLQVRPFSPAEPFRLVVPLRSDTAGRASIFLRSVNNAVWPDTGTVAVAKGAQVLSFRLPDTAQGAFSAPAKPQDAIRAIRLNPNDHAGRVEVGEMRIVGPDDETIVIFPPQAFSPSRKDLGLSVAADRVVFTGGPDAGIFVVPKTPLPLVRRTLPFEPATTALQFAGAALAMLLALVLAGRVSPAARGRIAGALAKFRDDQAAWPGMTIFAAAVLATVLSCYPVVFCGKSFVSPNNGATMLYDDFPTVPQAPQEAIEAGRGSDLGATMWAHLPYSVVQHRSVFRDGELPLWNRYSYCGLPLLGQGQSMLGDPLHWIPVAAGGAAWAWDVKFCVAKLLFSLGVGLLAFHATRRVWLSVLLALSSSFIGFFAFRFNHCAFFSLSYAPWVLLCWLRAAQSAARVWPWALALAAANFWELSSGTAKEAAMLIAGLNFTGGLLVLTARMHLRERLRRLALMGLGLVIFMLLAAPHWMLFLDALRQAWTAYESQDISQLRPGVLLGIFDDLFLSQTAANEKLLGPSVNFLVLLGCLWAGVNLRGLLREPVFRAVLLGALPPAAMVFGVVPPAVIARLPFLANISHVDNTFTCVLVIHLFVIAAFGLRSLWDGAAGARMRADAVIAAILLLLLAALFLVHFQTGGFGKMSTFFRAYAIALGVAVLSLPWIVRQWRTRPCAEPVVFGALCIFLIHFRHGLWVATKFDSYVTNPRTRADLAAPSPACLEVAASFARDGGPQRVAGLGGVLVPGFNAVLGLEHFNGADAVVNRWQRELIEKSGISIQWLWRCMMMRGDFPRARAIGDVWNVGWYLGTPSEQPRKVDGLVLSATLDLDLYKSPTVWPRAFFADRLVECSSLDQFVHLVGAANGTPFAALVPEASARDAQPPAKSGAAVPPAASAASLEGRIIVPADGYRLTENTTTFTIHAPMPGVAVLGNSYERGNWRVTLDGKPADYFRVNQAFLGVQIPEAGTHVLHFKYWPRLLTPALWAALSGLLIAAATAVAGMCSRSVRPAGAAAAVPPDAENAAANAASKN